MRLYVVGGDGVVNELKLGGFEIIHASNEAPTNVEMDDETLKRVVAATPLVDGVVVGFDNTFSYERLCRASLALQKNPDAFLCATNEDAFVRFENYSLPGNGAIAASLRFCLETTCGKDREYIVTGKPDARIVDFILGKCGGTKERCLMVGDRLDTDMALATNSGISGCLVLSGCSTEAEIEGFYAKPTYVVQSVAELFQ
jgi:phosphoglycolate phosphatase